jgi:hypothetical protein
MSGDWRGTLWTLVVTFCIVIIRCTETYLSPCITVNNSYVCPTAGRSYTKLQSVYYVFIFEKIFITVRQINYNVNVISGTVEITSPHNVKNTGEYLTSCSKVLLENLLVCSPVKQFCAFYGILCVITVFKTRLTFPHPYLYESSLRPPFLPIGAPF